MLASSRDANASRLLATTENEPYLAIRQVFPVGELEKLSLFWSQFCQSFHQLLDVLFAVPWRVLGVLSLEGQAHLQTQRALATSQGVGENTTRDAVEPEQLLVSRLNLIEATPGNYESLSYEVFGSAVVVEATKRITQQCLPMRRDYSRYLRVLVAYLSLSFSHHYVNVRLARIPSLHLDPPSHPDGSADRELLNLPGHRKVGCPNFIHPRATPLLLPLGIHQLNLNTRLDGGVGNVARDSAVHRTALSLMRVGVVGGYLPYPPTNAVCRRGINQRLTTAMAKSY